MERAEQAVLLMEEGHACSQSIIEAFAADYGLDADVAARMAAGFHGGMFLGEACGAVTGAVMVLSLALCDERCVTNEGRAAVTAAVMDFAERFRERVGALDCPDIIGVDVREPNAIQAALAQDLFTQRCVPAVRAAGEILEEML